MAIAIKKSGGGGADLGGPDLGAVGASARVSKKASAIPQDLTSFSVKKGDNGGVIVSEIYEKKAPEGRRPASFLLGGAGDVKENPFSAKDGAAATAHITGLLGQMGIQGVEPEGAAEDLAPEPPPGLGGPPPGLGGPPPGPPPAAALRGPRGGGVAMRGPGPGGPPPPDLGY